MAQQLICSACGHIGSSKTAVKGSILIEIVLWLCFIIPGVIYSLWRSTSRYKKCKVCGSTTLIPVDSPNGKKLLEAQGKTVDQVLAEKPAGRSKAEKITIVFMIVAVIIIIALLSNGV